MGHKDYMHEKKQGKFLNGFFWGAVIGGGVAYLLSTQKGRDFVKDLIQDGVDMLEDATAPEPEVYEEMPSVQEETTIIEEMVQPSRTVASSQPQESVYASTTQHVQAHAEEKKEVKKGRFFKKPVKK